MVQNRRLIDADELHDKVEEKYKCSQGSYRPTYLEFVDDIANAPTVDAVEVVRCKDCKHYRQYPKSPKACFSLPLTPHFVREDDFCSYAERKDNE